LVPSPHLSRHDPIAGLSNVTGRKGLEVSKVSTGLWLAGCRDCSEAARTQALHCQRSHCKVTPDTGQGFKKEKREGLEFLILGMGARFLSLLVMDLSSFLGDRYIGISLDVLKPFGRSMLPESVCNSDPLLYMAIAWQASKALLHFITVNET